MLYVGQTESSSWRQSDIRFYCISPIRQRSLFSIRSVVIMTVCGNVILQLDFYNRLYQLHKLKTQCKIKMQGPLFTNY